ncbi:MAG TPA: MFS transporter, partial [Gemmatimonadales bacterium]|nr:MFS transporter [Gemmatimonadales bacterium]
VSELVEPGQRGTANTLLNMMGVAGASAAAIVGELLPWRTAYVVGGALGLLVLVVRARLRDSAMFERARAGVSGRGDLRHLVNDAGRAARYARAILIGVPIWFTTGVLIIFAPEFAQALGVAGEITNGRAVLAYYSAGVLGMGAAGLLSERLRSRRGAVAVFLALGLAANAAYLLGLAATPAAFYALCFCLGLTSSYWVVMMTMATEQFGTDLRATVATSVPSFVRASAVPLTLAFLALGPTLGVAGAAATVGAVTWALAALALWRQPETYGRDLDFVEAP